MLLKMPSPTALRGQVTVDDGAQGDLVRNRARRVINTRAGGGRHRGRKAARRVVLALVATMLGLGGWGLPGAPPAAAFGTSEPAPVPSVSAGGYMSCGVRVDQTAACWGENGMPSNDVANTSPGGASTPPAGVTFLEVNAGYATGCGVKTDRSLVCWGSDRFAKHVVPTGTFTHVVPGVNYVCALRTDGTITCWGGDDPAIDPDQKVIRDVPAGQFSQLTLGSRHACALRADGSGSIVCWGQNTIRLGVPEGQTVVPPGTYSDVNVSNFTSCALRIDGTPVCWGRTLNGQQTPPIDAGGAPLTFTQVSTGSSHVCGLRGDGSVVCWGRNFEGQASPVPAGTYTQVTAGTFHTCGMRVGETEAVCWGNNMSGRVQPNMSSVTPQQGYVGFPYSFQFAMNPSGIAGSAAIVGISPTPSFSLVEGSLPAGMSLSPAGLLSGSPTEAGTFAIKVAAGNGLSPRDCAVPLTLAAPGDSQSMPCVPGTPSSVATATRAFTVTVSADAPPPGTIAGLVTTAADTAPAGGATVTVTHTGGALAGQATTTSDGAYSIGDLAPGSYTVAANGTELQPQTKAAVVVEGQTTTVNFAMTPLIRPTITSIWNNHFDTVSDGLFIEWSEEISPFLGGLDRPARYTVHTDAACATTAIATGAESFWEGGHPHRRDLVLDTRENIVDGGSYHLRVAADTELGMESEQRNALACAPFTASLDPAHRTSVEGVVTDAEGAPIAGATVTVVRTIRDAGTAAGQATTDAAGRYLIGDLAPGPYDVVAAAPGYVSGVTGISTDVDPSATASFVLNTAGDDAYSHFGSDTALAVAAPGVLANDPGATTATLVEGPSRGTLDLNPDGSFSYQPDEDQTGTVSFTYSSAGEAGGSATATATITVGAGCRGRAATITGSGAGDRLRGTAGDDVIAGLGGDDTVLGAAGNDVVCGGAGNDRLNSDGGDDHLVGGSGDDVLQGGAGNDTLSGDDGADQVTGGDGDDVLAGGGGAPDRCLGGGGSDALAPGHGCERAKGIT